MKKSGVYKLTHVRTGLFYIGHTGDIDARKKIHVSELSNGRSSISNLNAVFERGDELLWEFTATVDKSEAIGLERKLIRENVDCVGICNQVHAGYHLSEDRRQLLSEYAKGRVISDETRRKMSESLKGRVMSPESIEKSRRGNLGRTRSDEARKRMSDGHKLSPMSSEGRKRISEAKSVPFVLDGVSYSSTEEASRLLGVHRTTVRARRRREDNNQ